MTKAPAFPVTNDKDRNPFLNDGVSEVEFLDGKIVDGPPNDPIPAFVFDVKVLKSSNAMNQLNAPHTIRIKCKGFSWGKQVQEIVGAAGLLPKTAINNQVAEGLLVAGKLKGRRFAVEMSSHSNAKGASWREYRCAAMETTPVI